LIELAILRARQLASKLGHSTGVTAMRAKATATVSLSVRVTPTVKAAAERAAEERQQSLKDYLESVLSEATEREDSLQVE
jgi:hypothetical protein